MARQSSVVSLLLVGGQSCLLSCQSHARRRACHRQQRRALFSPPPPPSRRRVPSGQGPAVASLLCCARRQPPFFLFSAASRQGRDWFEVTSRLFKAPKKPGKNSARGCQVTRGGGDMLFRYYGRLRNPCGGRSAARSRHAQERLFSYFRSSARSRALCRSCRERGGGMAVVAR